MLYSHLPIEHEKEVSGETKGQSKKVRCGKKEEGRKAIV